MYNFTYSYPVRMHLGKEILEGKLREELKKVGNTVLFAYGNGSVKRNGLYDRVYSQLEQAGKNVIELSKISADPLYEKVQEGAELCRHNKVDFILALGGGSVVDCCKVISAQARLKDDIWEYECVRRLTPKEFIPVGAVMTAFGTGAEQNNSGVITNRAAEEKRSLKGSFLSFAILDIECTRSLPMELLLSGAFDTLSHCMETYFSLPDEISISDEINEAVMRNVIRNMRVIKENPDNENARRELAWDSAMGMNGIIKMGKKPAFQAHQIAHQLGAYTNCTHGKALSVIQPVYYRKTYKRAIPKFARFAREVWGIRESQDDEKLALAGICSLERFVREMGLPYAIDELGVEDGVIKKVVRSTFIMDTSCERLTTEKILEILEECFA